MDYTLPRCLTTSTRFPTAAVNHADPAIDQLLQIKQMAWLCATPLARRRCNFSNALNAGKMNADIQQNLHIKNVGGTDIAWNALQLAAAGMQLPAKLSDAIAATKSAYFDPHWSRDSMVESGACRRKETPS